MTTLLVIGYLIAMFVTAVGLSYAVRPNTDGDRILMTAVSLFWPLVLFFLVVIGFGRAAVCIADLVKDRSK